MPNPLKDILEDFELVDRGERAELLIEYADEFQDVPPEVATRPFPEENHVTRCESEAYVWAKDNADGTQKYYFAVENPQGLSAKAWAVIMDKTLSNQPLEQVAAVTPEVIFDIYGRDVSMGKGQGMMGMLDHVQSHARRRLRERREAVT
ncbi:MAG TPA: SufE family protein [Tepidiformaceae bacterium]|nr:SufE family protein [Tepidiformaceae bacterium]HSE47405.1 SufE family protein [Gemmatimonadales bacterium]